MFNKTKKDSNNNKQRNFMPVLWVLTLFSIGSIVFSSCYIIMTSTDLLPKLIILPQIVFAAALTIYKFVK